MAFNSVNPYDRSLILDSVSVSYLQANRAISTGAEAARLTAKDDLYVDTGKALYSNTIEPFSGSTVTMNSLRVFKDSADRYLSADAGSAVLVGTDNSDGNNFAAVKCAGTEVQLVVRPYDSAASETVYDPTNDESGDKVFGATSSLVSAYEDMTVAASKVLRSDTLYGTSADKTVVVGDLQFEASGVVKSLAGSTIGFTPNGTANATHRILSVGTEDVTVLNTLLTDFIAGRAATDVSIYGAATTEGLTVKTADNTNELTLASTAGRNVFNLAIQGDNRITAATSSITLDAGAAANKVTLTRGNLASGSDSLNFQYSSRPNDKLVVSSADASTFQLSPSIAADDPKIKIMTLTFEELTADAHHKIIGAQDAQIKFFYDNAGTAAQHAYVGVDGFYIDAAKALFADELKGTSVAKSVTLGEEWEFTANKLTFNGASNEYFDVAVDVSGTPSDVFRVAQNAVTASSSSVVASFNSVQPLTNTAALDLNTLTVTNPSGPGSGTALNLSSSDGSITEFVLDKNLHLATDGVVQTYQLRSSETTNAKVLDLGGVLKLHDADDSDQTADQTLLDFHFDPNVWMKNTDAALTNFSTMAYWSNAYTIIGGDVIHLGKSDTTSAPSLEADYATVHAGATTVHGDITVTGNMTVQGTTSTLSTTIVTMEDSFFQVAKKDSGTFTEAEITATADGMAGMFLETTESAALSGDNPISAQTLTDLYNGDASPTNPTKHMIAYKASSGNDAELGRWYCTNQLVVGGSDAPPSRNLIDAAGGHDADDFQYKRSVMYVDQVKPYQRTALSLGPVSLQVTNDIFVLPIMNWEIETSLMDNTMWVMGQGTAHTVTADLYTPVEFGIPEGNFYTFPAPGPAYMTMLPFPAIVDKVHIMTDKMTLNSEVQEWDYLVMTYDYASGVEHVQCTSKAGLNKTTVNSNGVAPEITSSMTRTATQNAGMFNQRADSAVYSAPATSCTSLTDGTAVRLQSDTSRFGNVSSNMAVSVGLQRQGSDNTAGQITLNGYVVFRRVIDSTIGH